MDENGDVQAIRSRSNWDSFRWRSGDQLIPYGIWHRWHEVPGELAIVEGESDALTLWELNVPAIGIPGAATWRPEWRKYIGKRRPVLLMDNDDAGRQLRTKLARSLGCIWWVTPQPYKDISEAWIAINNRKAFHKYLDSLMQNLRCYTPPVVDHLLRDTRGTEPLLPIVQKYVELSKRGRDWWGLCPFHAENTASFHVTPDKNIWYCFGCGEGGGPNRFRQLIERVR
jgi:hypothetical protein